MKVTIVGGFNSAQTLWTLHRGFERAGCGVTYLPHVTTAEGSLRRVCRPDLMREIARELDGGTQLVMWWQPLYCVPCGDLLDARKAYPEVRFAMQSLDDPFFTDSEEDSDLGSVFDVAVTCCEGSFGWYEKLGIKPMLGYPSCDRDRHGSGERGGYDCDFLFMATGTYPQKLYPHVLASRDEMIKSIDGLGDTHLYGYWEERPNDWGRSLNNKGMFKGYSLHENHAPLHRGARINLNSHVRPDGYKYLNERVANTMASGGFMLCDRVNGIEEIMTDGVHCALWGSLDELRDKAEWYLSHDAERERICDAGRKLAGNLFDNERLARKIIEGVGL